MGGTFRALGARNYRLFFVGQTLSLIGSWMESVAMSWLVYRLTGSEVLLGTVAFSTQIPMFLVSPFAGVVSDRRDRRKMLIATQTLFALLSLILAALVLSGRVQVWHILCLSVLVGIVNAYDAPARQALVPDLVEDRDHLANAIALNSTQFNIARLIGPALAGFAIAALGEGWCFFVNAVSFLAVIGALVAIRVEHTPRVQHRGSPIEQIREGAAYAWRLHPIRVLLMLLALSSFVGGAYQVLLPVFAKEIFHGDSHTLGYLYSAVGVGALVAATMLASRRSVVGLGRWVVASSAIFAIAMAVFGQSKSIGFALPLLVAMGFGMMKHMGSTNTLIQSIVEDHVRGRVMAFYTMAFIGTMPIGSLLSGFMSARLGPSVTLLIMGVAGLLGSIAFYRSLPEFRRVLRPIYERKGILPAS